MWSSPTILRALRFFVPLLAVLAALAWVAWTVLDTTSRRWTERDVALRAELAVSGAREALATHVRSGDRGRLVRVLTELTRDDRIMATAACSREHALLASTSDFPAAFDCSAIGAHLVVPESGEPWSAWTRIDDLRGGPVHVSAIPLVDDADLLGFVILIHDMSFAARRGAKVRRFSLIVFAVLAIAAAVVTMLVARLSWRRWTLQMRQLIRGNTDRAEFKPILRDVRELVARLATEGAAGGDGSPWDPERLRRVLRRHLHGEKVVIVANREPYIHERAPDGGVRILHPASGLVTALEPVMRACSGVWVAHGSGSADRETVDRHGRILVPPGEESYAIRRVWLSAEEEKGYYYGFANEGLWPLCHIAHTRPTFRSEDWAHYQRVNEKFADAVLSEVDSVDPIILVQDYHFALAPRMIRERLPRATILTFWHIPWPNSERFGICPFTNEILDGLLGSSIVGFHTQFHCNNFVDSVDRFLEARIDREQQAVVLLGRPTLIRPYPISVEWPNHWIETSPPVEECRGAVRAELGLPPDALLGVGVDRLDYTKGVEERLLAVERLLERYPQFRGRFTFVQLAAPSRTKIERYRDLNQRVEQLADRINSRFSTGSYRPVVLQRAHHEPPTVFRYYRAADVCYVSSLHDGMNLVSKEFVAARDDERGVLVLSRFTGAAKELTDALVVNPYDLEQASAALATALAMPVEEQEERMRAMRALVAEYNVYRWAGRMLVDSARLRQQDRQSGRRKERLRTADLVP
jgi:trehalose 6-phosphate synthase